MNIRFDDSLPVLARVIAEQLGHDVLMHGAALRDTRGRLTFFAAEILDSQTVERVSHSLRQQLGAYARHDRVLACSDDISASYVLDDPDFLLVDAGAYRVRLVDRRLVGADWLRAPAGLTQPPPRFVFSSVKGGVGRSTALAIAALDLAARGQRVLAVDLDLEAPGLGPMLLAKDKLPDFGTLDALVEDGVSGLDDAFLGDLIRSSPLAAEHGRVDVMPAFGRRTLCHPAEALSKIARAYVEHFGQDGAVISFRNQVVDLIERFANPDRYDAILVDVRAGLHASTAASFLGLGAEVFLFGTDEQQTFDCFAVLFAHLAHLLHDEAAVEWLSRVNVVQAKAPVEYARRAAFAERCRETAFKAGLPPRRQTQQQAPPAAPFGGGPWDEPMLEEQMPSGEADGICAPVAVLYDQNYIGFDPFARRELLAAKVYDVTFGSLLNKVRAGVTPQGPAEPITPPRGLR